MVFYDFDLGLKQVCGNFYARYKAINHLKPLYDTEDNCLLPIWQKGIHKKHYFIRQRVLEIKAASGHVHAWAPSHQESCFELASLCDWALCNNHGPTPHYRNSVALLESQLLFSNWRHFQPQHCKRNVFLTQDIYKYPTQTPQRPTVSTAAPSLTVKTGCDLGVVLTETEVNTTAWSASELCTWCSCFC